MQFESNRIIIFLKIFKQKFERKMIIYHLQKSNQVKKNKQVLLIKLSIILI